jgi:hypothetical protein
MESLVALSLAANIAQFIEFSSKIIHVAKEIHESASGKTQENFELESIINSMRVVSAKFDPPSTGIQSEDDQALRRLAADCTILSNQLDQLLQNVLSKDPRSKQHSIASALKNLLSRRERLELERRLANCRSQLEFQLTFMTMFVSLVKINLDRVNSNIVPIQRGGLTFLRRAATSWLKSST